SDSISGASGVLSGVDFASGEVGQAFNFHGGTNSVLVVAGAGVNPGLSTNGLRIEGWIKPANLTLMQPLVEWNTGNAIGAHFWISQAWFENQGGPGALFANLIDTSGGTHALVSAPGILQTNVFQHVAVTYNRLTGTGTLYVNAAPVYTVN